MSIIRNHVEKRLVSYGAVSLALAAVGSTQSAFADVIYFPENVTTTLGTGVYFNPLTGHIDTGLMPGDYELLTDLEGTKTAARLVAFGGNQFVVAPFTSLASVSSVARLSLNDLIGPALKFAIGFSTLASNSFQNNGHFKPLPAHGYVGLGIFQGSTPLYGWADITIHGDLTITLNAVGANTSGIAVRAGAGAPAGGAAPEPPSILLLALGAAGVAAYRRKQASAHVTE